jgi:hypothetical protein
MKQKISPVVENVAESTAACLITMGQGNILAAGLSHWLIASQTGVVAGVVTSAAMLAAQTDRRWVVSLTLGAVTAVVDFFMHPGGFGPEFLEAAITGIGATLLSWMVGSIVHYLRSPERVTQ